MAVWTRANAQTTMTSPLGGDILNPVSLDAPEGQPAVPPAAHLAGTAAAGAVALASVRGDVTRREERLRRFLKSGRNIATGGPGRLPAETA